MTDIHLSPQVFSILSGLIQEKVGLHYGLLDRETLQAKVSGRALDLGFESLLDYYYFIRYDAAGDKELSELVESLVVNETYFFREWQTIRALLGAFIKPWCAEGRRPRIWCAACSTGEEPLSLAMLLKSEGLLAKVEIVASDISENALRRARSGRFGKRAVRQVPEKELLDRFIVVHHNHHEVSSELIETIQWKRTNIVNEEEYPDSGSFDVILCRNLLIYFNDDTIRDVLEKLSRKLTPDGVLVVGVSESLLRFGGRFVGEEHAGSFFYRKAGLDE